MPLAAAAFSIAAAEPESIGAMMSTFAPSEMHWSACVFCFWGSPWAFTTRAEMPAALNALIRYGLSNCSQRTDVFVSGISPQARMPADVLAAPVTVTTSPATAAAMPTAVTFRERCFTCSSLFAFPAWPASCRDVGPSLIHARSLVKSRGRPGALGSAPVKTSLGIWALGPMVTRFVPGGYQPQWAGETTAERVRRAVEGLGDLIDGYEFHYPQEISEQNADAVLEALGDHDVYCVAGGLHLDPRFGRGGLVNPDAAVRSEALRIALAGADLAGQ